MAGLFPDMFLNVQLSLILYNRKVNNLCERVNFIPVKGFAYSSCKEFTLFQLELWMYVNPLGVLYPSPCLKLERKTIETSFALWRSIGH